MNNKTAALGRGHVIRSSVWIVIGQVGAQILRLANNLIMTRLLVPEMFGIMMVANTVMVGLWLCSYIGLEHNVIQSPRGDDPKFLDAAWTFQILRGIFLWLLALAASLGLYFAHQAGLVPISSAYADPILPKVLIVLAFLPLLSGFESTKLYLASRHMQVKRLTILELGSQLLSVLAMIGFALVHQSIWALVFGAIISAVIRLAASFWIMPGQHNRFSWDVEAFSDLFGFGKWILLTTVMGFFVKSSDKLILGALVTPKLLGIYGIAIFMTAAINQVLSVWAGKVALPVFSKAYRETPERIANFYYKFSTPFNFVTLFLCGFLFNAGHVIIEMLYDSRYAAAGPMIQILSIALLGSRSVLAEQCYIAIGKPKLSVPMNIIQLVILFGGLAPAYRWYGMDGALYVIGLTTLFTLPITWYWLKKIGILNWKLELITLPALLLGYWASKLFLVGYDYIKAFIAS